VLNIHHPSVPAWCIMGRPLLLPYNSRNRM